MPYGEVENSSEEVVAVCYFYRDRKEEEARRKREEELRKQREEQARRAEKEKKRSADRERELVRA